jgi:DNA-binding CsgD family transcriptional regulator/tetratricopeptide (TPR) repeat protein
MPRGQTLSGHDDEPTARRSSQALRGRRDECGTLDELLDAVRRGDSRTLVLRGEPGVGKSALLEYVVERASGCRVVRAAGVQSEMELPFAGLQQLCAKMLDRLERLPGPQRDALGTAFGLSAGEAPDRFLVGLAVLSLLTHVAEERPLVCLVDDAQWLDRASAQALAFVARRLSAESVAVVFAERALNDQELTAVPELVVEGLGYDAARALLDSALKGPLDERVLHRIVAETRGNPLALLELPRGLTPAQLAGGFGLPNALPLSGQIEESFRRRLEPLPVESQRLLLVAAAEAVGEPGLVRRAAEGLGVAVEAAVAPAVAAGLLEFGAHVQFRHPLVRSAVYRAASLEDRRSVHRALAEVTDTDADPDRRAWHLAHAAPGPDEKVALELERSAGRAQARGGLAAAAAFLEQAFRLTLEPARRAERALAAAQAEHQAGSFDAALQLLATAEGGPLDELQLARVDLLRAQIAFAMNRGSGAPPLLLKAAKRLERLDVKLARETYLDALTAAVFAHRLASSGGVLEVAEAARAAPPSSQPPGAADLLLDGWVLLITEGHAAGVPVLKRAMRACCGETISNGEEIRRLWLACHTAFELWDDETWHVLSTRMVRLARDAGALTELPIALNSLSVACLFAGDFSTASALVDEAAAVNEVTGGHLAPYGAVLLAACQGREARASELIEAGVREVTRRGEGMGLTVIQWASALFYNGVGRSGDALAAAQQASQHAHDPTRALPELIEAAIRSGVPEQAADALQRLSQATRASGTEWALGIEASSRALLSENGVAEGLYREAIDRLGRTRVRVALARAHLLYGEWLRRKRRRLDAREELRIAHEMFTAMGIEAFAQRAARELLATGETARKRTIEPRGQLTAQEAQVARLARDGLSNAEIGARLFISTRTVEYHLHKVFAKLDIGSRNQLHRVLP